MPTDRTSRRTAALLCSSLLAAGSLTGCGQEATSSPPDGVVSSSSDPGPTPYDDAPGTAAPHDNDHSPGQPGTTGTTEAGSPTPSRTPTPDKETEPAEQEAAGTETGGAETLEDEDDPGTLEVEQPRTAPLVELPLPRSALAKDRLVAGFPTVLRPAPGSDVATSSVSVAAPRLQVALVASTSRPVDAVLRSFRLRFSRWGLAERTGALAVGNAQVATFSRGRSTISVTATREDELTRYEVFATLHAAE